MGESWGDFPCLYFMHIKVTWCWVKQFHITEIYTYLGLSAIRIKPDLYLKNKIISSFWYILSFYTTELFHVDEKCSCLNQSLIAVGSFSLILSVHRNLQSVFAQFSSIYSPTAWNSLSPPLQQQTFISALFTNRIKYFCYWVKYKCNGKISWNTQDKFTANKDPKPKLPQILGGYQTPNHTWLAKLTLSCFSP